MFSSVKTIKTNGNLPESRRTVHACHIIITRTTPAQKRPEHRRLSLVSFLFLRTCTIYFCFLTRRWLMDDNTRTHYTRKRIGATERGKMHKWRRKKWDDGGTGKKSEFSPTKDAIGCLYVERGGGASSSSSPCRIDAKVSGNACSLSGLRCQYICIYIYLHTDVIMIHGIRRSRYGYHFGMDLHVKAACLIRTNRLKSDKKWTWFGSFSFCLFFNVIHFFSIYFIPHFSFCFGFPDGFSVQIYTPYGLYYILFTLHELSGIGFRLCMIRQGRKTYTHERNVDLTIIVCRSIVNFFLQMTLY